MYLQNVAMKIHTLNILFSGICRCLNDRVLQVLGQYLRLFARRISLQQENQHRLPHEMSYFSVTRAIGFPNWI